MDTNATVVALGFFDGVHLGHAALLRTAVDRARALGCQSAAFTFDRSPREFVTGEPVPLLSTVEERSALMREKHGIDRVFVAPFDRTMMEMRWQDFLEKELLGACHAVHLVAGHDYRFGHKNEGTPELLRSYCAAHGIGCDIVARVEADGETVSSTLIRTLIERGELARAAVFLGRSYALCGTVCHGRGLGSSQLFATANLTVPTQKLLPKDGVYVTRTVCADGKSYPAVTNVGTRPTVQNGGEKTVETHLIGFSGDLYGTELSVHFLTRLRDEMRFSSPDALREQIKKDIENAKEQNKKSS